MICDALQEDEIFEAYLLYASLHGMSTDEADLRGRIARYLGNQPDATIDDAILAYAEDRIVAPPEVVLPQWGKSRVYELREAPPGNWRHRVCEAWFNNGCHFLNDDRDPRLAHFWTVVVLDDPSAEVIAGLTRGARLQFLAASGAVHVAHRRWGRLGRLNGVLADELHARGHLDLRYLPLVYALEGGEEPNVPRVAKLLVTMATRGVSQEEICEYATRAFHAPRIKC